jgi:hypothetical protein
MLFDLFRKEIKFNNIDGYDDIKDIRLYLPPYTAAAAISRNIGQSITEVEDGSCNRKSSMGPER